MGRNKKDFWGDYSSDGPMATSPNTEGASHTKVDGAAVTRVGNQVMAVSDSGHSASRKVTRNRDIGKQGKRLAKVAKGVSKPIRNDRTTR